MKLNSDITIIKYFDNFDGLRFISALAVIFFHKFNNTTWLFYEENPLIYRVGSFFSRNGLIGVNFFFVLSGFLITYLIHQEIKKNGTFNFKNFIIRRILRIWPLYFLILSIGFLLKSDLDGIGYYLTFLSNIEVILHNDSQSAILFPLWSVSIEEQFYFIIPLIIYLFRLKKAKHFFTLYSVLLIISIGYQIINRSDINKLHYSTLSCITDLSIGGIVATLSYYSLHFINTVERLKKKWIVIIYLMGILFIFSRVYFHHNSLFHAFERSILAIFFAFILAEQTYSKQSLFKIKNWKFISISGQYTYSIYLFHMLLVQSISFLWLKYNWYDNAYIDTIIKTFLVIIVTYLLSILSNKYFERPFLKLKTKFIA